MISGDISIIDVGHGNSAVLHDNGHTVVVDCGSHGASLLQFLQDRGINEINRVYLSHADKDHISGLLSLLASDVVLIHEVFLNSDGSKSSKLWDDLVTLLHDKSRRQEVVFEVNIQDEMHPYVLGNVVVKHIGPSKYLLAKGVGNADREGRRISSNSISASFIVFYRDVPLVFLSGDLDKVGLDEIIYNGHDISSHVLVFPHHGGKIGEGEVVSFTNELIARVKPSTVVFSIGRRKYSNPRPEIINAIKGSGAHVRIACTQLSEHCCAELPKEDPVHLHSYYAKGKHLRECCSGTYVISLGDSITQMPSDEAHFNFIRLTANTAMCI